MTSETTDNLLAALALLVRLDAQISVERDAVIDGAKGVRIRVTRGNREWNQSFMVLDGDPPSLTGVRFAQALLKLERELGS